MKKIKKWWLGVPREKKLKFFKILIIVSLSSLMIFFYIRHFVKSSKAETLTAYENDVYYISNVLTVDNSRNYGISFTNGDSFITQNTNTFNLLINDSTPFSYSNSTLNIAYQFMLDVKSKEWGFMIESININNSFVPNDVFMYNPNTSQEITFDSFKWFKYPINTDYEEIRFKIKTVMSTNFFTIKNVFDDFNEDSIYLPLLYTRKNGIQEIQFINAVDEPSTSINLGLNIFGNKNTYDVSYFDFSKILYDKSYDLIYNKGYEDGKITGKLQGYEDGYSKGVLDSVGDEENPPILKQVFKNILEYPVNLFKEIFNFEIGGVNVSIAIMTFITVLVCVFIVKKLI